MFALQPLLHDLAVVLQDHRVRVVPHDVSAVVSIGAQYVPGTELLSVDVATPGNFQGTFKREETSANS